MKVVCSLNSSSSYERIKNEIHEPADWQLERSIERLRATLATDYFELAIIDQTIENFDEIIELLEFKEVKMLIFRGQYDEIIMDARRKIKEIIAEEEIEEIHERLEEEESSDSNQPFKVMVKEVVRTERVEVPVIQNVANSLISVLNLSERAGSTFIAANLARSFAQYDVPITLFESPIGTVDSYYTMGFYDDTKSYYSYRKAMKTNGRIEKQKLPFINGVSIAVNEPSFDSADWRESDTLKLFASYSGINIVDLGWDFQNPKIKELIDISNLVLVVVDPISTQIVRNEDRLVELEKMIAAGVDVRFIFNKWDEEINRKKFEEGFNLQPFMVVPFLPAENIYSTYYNADYEFLIDHKVVGEILENSFYPLIKEYVKDIENKSKKIRRSFFSFGRR